jgi:histone arginine demethylase JMJD6
MKFEIEHRDNLSYEQFAKEYLYANKPVVVTDVLRNWKAVKEWTPEFFKKNFASMTFKLEEKPKAGYKGNGDNSVEYTMERFIDRVLASTEENPAPYFRNQILYDLFPSLKNDIEPLPEYFQPNWLPDRYMVKYVGEVLNRGAALELYIGGNGGAFPVLHYDGAGAHAFLMQVYGRKQFIIYPPSQEKFLYPSPEKENLSLINSVDNPDLSKFPLFAQAEPTVFILEPGEMLFIPSHWWHTTKMLTPSISISANVVNQSNWHELVTFVSMRRRNPLMSLASRVYLTGAGAKRSWRDRHWRKRALAS